MKVEKKAKIFLILHEITVTDMCKELECSREYLNLVLNGKRTPSLKFAKKIEIFTEGALMPKDFGLKDKYSRDYIQWAS